MKKIALFVEGQTELIFVKNLLLAIYTYNVDITCHKLRSQGNKSPTNFDFRCTNSNVHYQLIDVGNDTAVLQRMLDREKGLIEAGYSLIVGLRDMYGSDYCDFAKTIDIVLIRKFIQTTKNTILNKSSDPAKLKFCFAIMEVEAWFIALRPFEKMHKDLIDARISTIIDCDFSVVDSERFFYKPSSALKKIYSSIQLDYDKSEKVVESLCSNFTIEDYLRLAMEERCASFSYFCKTISII